MLQNRLEDSIFRAQISPAFACLTMPSAPIKRSLKDSFALGLSSIILWSPLFWLFTLVSAVDTASKAIRQNARRGNDLNTFILFIETVCIVQKYTHNKSDFGE